MKRFLAVTAATAALTLSLAACGAEGSVELRGGAAANDGITATDTMKDGTVQRSARTAKDDADAAQRSGAAGTAVDYSSAAAVHRAAVAGDRYARMLENGMVHDADGYLLDGENAGWRTF